MDINHEIGVDPKNQIIALKIKPALLDKEVVYQVPNSLGPDARPVRFFTCTSDMRDFIGNVVAFDQREGVDLFCSVHGLYRGRMRTIRNVKVRDAKICKTKERVMVTEHLNVAGGFDLLASKQRILDLRMPQLNFINIGWEIKTEKGSQIAFVRVDPFTGESKIMEKA